MIRMLGQVDGRCSALTDLFLDGIVSDGSADHLFSRHAAKLIESGKTG
jgi:hypothetical protein